MARVVLIGHPVAGSLAPAMHNAAFAALGLPHRYEAQDVDEDTLPRILEALRGDEWLGANVTAPYRERVPRLLDELMPEARAAGAVDTVARRARRLIGHNTAPYGFSRAMDPAPEGKRVLVLGAGGAARSVLVELAGRNEIVLASRRQAQAEQLAAEHAKDARRPPRAVSWRGAAALEGVDVLVNATPLGARGEDVLKEVGLASIPETVVDLVATARETPLVRRAREAATKGARVVDGLDVLLYQAARAFTLWTGREAPLRVMAGALPRPVTLSGRKMPS